MIKKIVIIGAGPTGLIFSLLSSASNHSISLVEGRAAFERKNDKRALALSASSRYILEKIGVWNDIEEKIIPIKEIIVIQNGISPNGDNINDKWGINNIINTGIYYNVRIFNKWGGILYTSSYPDIVEWDGKFNGSYVPAADYYYLISFKETNQNYSGTITVKY